MNDDGDLLRQFAATGDDACFRQLVERRIGFVYAVNLRRLGDAHLAQDATQAVFIALARKAARVAESPSVVGWLHRSSCYESHNMRRAHFNRLTRESEAHRLGIVHETPSSGASSEFAGVLDEVLSKLPQLDREAILARYFSQQTYAQIGLACRTTENAARMRVERALLKLRDALHRRGFESTAALLAGTLSSYATTIVPAGLSGAVTQAAVAGCASATLATSFFALMNTTTMAGVVVALAASVVGFQIYKTHHLEQELVAMRADHATATTEVRGLEQRIKDLNAQWVAANKTSSSTVAVTPPTPVLAVVPPGVTRKAPAGWRKNGSNPAAYEVGVDQNQTWGGMPSAYVESKSSNETDGFGGMMQTTSAEAFKNQRVRLTGWVKTADARQGGNLWLRIDGATERDMLGFDNMNGRAPKGTTDWQEYSIVLDVPKEATSLNYGFFVGGSGKMWVNGLTIQPVTSDVPTTNLRTGRPTFPAAPVNLGFSPN
jgi:RNA polymerase sigma factor (sigma-70 family)